MTQFAAYITRGLCTPRLIIPRVNGPIVSFCRLEDFYLFIYFFFGGGGELNITFRREARREHHDFSVTWQWTV